MSELFDPRGDFAQVVDGVAAVTLARPGGSATISIDAALRRVVSTREAATSDGKYTTSDVVWLFTLPSGETPPRVGDRIVQADGDRWTILSAQLEVAGLRWRCHARRLAIESGPEELVTIQRATWTKGAAGALVAAWSDRYAGVPARIQPVDAALNDDHNRRTLRVTHDVFLSQPVELAESDRIVALDGRCFLVVGFAQPERIDQFLVAHLHQQPEGALP